MARSRGSLGLGSLGCFARGIALVAALAGAPAFAQDTLRVGLLLTYSGTSALAGQTADNTIKLFQSKYGTSAGGKTIEFVRRDTTGPNPEVAKRLAQELIVREKVQLLIGPDFTPNALAVAPLLTEAKIPAIQTGSATSGIVGEKSAYYLRTFFSIPQVVKPMAQWAYRNGVRKPFVVVADYGPGHDAEATFGKQFQELGGNVAGVLKIPLRSPEFSSYLQRIKDSSPDAVFVFLPVGELCVQFLRAYAESGLKNTQIKLIGTGDLTDELYLDAAGDAALGVVTAGFYTPTHDSPLNRETVAGFTAMFGKGTPAVNIWDAMQLVYDGAKAQAGSKFDSDKFMAFARGRSFESPRGPITISASNGDILQNIYIRRVERRDGRLVNVEFETVRDSAAR